MATEVNLPALGESVTEGTVTRWLKQVGDSVAVDEPLLEVSTDKVDTEIPSPIAGTLLEIRANEDDTVEVGAVLAVIGDAGESSGDSGGAQAEAQPDPEPEPEAQPEPEPAQEQAQQEAQQPAAEQPAPAAEAKPSGGSGTAVTLPALGESVTEGTVTRWLKSVGDEVAVDEPLLEVSTDKVDTEIPSPVAGTLLEIKVAEDETVEVGAELAVIGSGQAAPAESKPEPTPEPEPEPTPEPEPEPEAAPEPEPAPAPQEQAAPPAPAPAAAAQPTAQPAAQPVASGDGPGYVTPLVRKMAAQHGVDLASVTGTGVGGRIRKQDVLDAAKAQQQAQQQAQQPAQAAPAAPAAPSAPVSSGAPSPLRGTTVKMSRLRKIIATRMVDSLQTSAQLTQVVEVDVTNIARLRDEAKADFLSREGVKLSYLPFFAKAAIDALKHHPALNATIDTEAGEVTYYDRENLAIAVDTEKGLITPVIKDAGDLSIAGLAKKIADVAQRTRTNKIGPDELSGGTFTITNLGSVGALWDTPIVNKPQVAILGPGAVVKRPVVIDDPNLGETIAVRYMVYLALTYDHQLVDGADAGRFLTDVKQRLESGQFEV
ncbi:MULTISPECIES: 2-oxoglutarate dehydrogenase, E2 component, dihydrolipoamide succinyltransferase [unclassified Nocardioides]|uniref:2-oxoglutarate dehydrogenase, E2 component, dihydrolipoamide succinyltransferase n=1 Tax=unclassified Nocardioides TaxID=2615069 RepID=UPI000056F90D|nr:MULTISPECIES: 2-oxoglutarate dehydrogenase, E2 component, dihydrolipoamide succinyltransferase [unclassified Nocardioides]ABL81808.1 2-oxoglutarate dehydrogenase E2 component [Nocardioides sp. JS614]